MLYINKKIENKKVYMIVITEILRTFLILYIFSYFYDNIATNNY